MSLDATQVRQADDHWSRWKPSEESVDRVLAITEKVYHRTKVQVIERLLGNDFRGQTVLDYGGGVGYFAVWFAERGARSILVDAEANALEIARLLAKRRGVA